MPRHVQRPAAHRCRTINQRPLPVLCHYRYLVTSPSPLRFVRPPLSPCVHAYSISLPLCAAVSPPGRVSPWASSILLPIPSSRSIFCPSPPRLSVTSLPDCPTLDRSPPPSVALHPPGVDSLHLPVLHSINLRTPPCTLFAHITPISYTPPSCRTSHQPPLHHPTHSPSVPPPPHRHAPILQRFLTQFWNCWAISRRRLRVTRSPSR